MNEWCVFWGSVSLLKPYSVFSCTGQFWVSIYVNKIKTRILNMNLSNDQIYVVEMYAN